MTNGTTGTVTFDVTADIQDFLDGVETNFGWLIKKAQEGKVGEVFFGWRESTTTPVLKLVIDES